MDAKLNQLKKKSRQYKPEFGTPYLAKVFNRGMGQLTFVALDESEKRVLVNDSIATPKDYERIMEVFPGYEIVKVIYGYPLYYRHSIIWAYENGYINN